MKKSCLLASLAMLEFGAAASRCATEFDALKIAHAHGPYNNGRKNKSDRKRNRANRWN